MGRAQHNWHPRAARRRTTGPRGARGPYRWTPEAIERDLRAVVSARGGLPTLAQLDALGRSDLRCAISDNGGLAHFAQRLNLPLPDTRARPRYTDEDALVDARRLIAEHAGLPGERTLRQLGHHRLATRVRNEGGAKAFVRKHNLSVPSTGDLDS